MYISSFKGKGMNKSGEARTNEGKVIKFSLRNSELTIYDEDKLTRDEIIDLIETLLQKHCIWLKYKGHRIGRRMNLRALLFGESKVLQFPKDKQQAMA